MIRDDLIENILDGTDIVEVIGSRIALKKAGRNFRANCPFHNEKTPSFIVSHDKQIYHCFGCGEGGNAISFLIKFEKLTFREALEALAEKANVKLPQVKFAEGAESSFLDRLYEVNDAAKTFYAARLAGPEGNLCRRYLADRGVNEESIKIFQIGYAPGSWDSILSFFAQSGTGAETVEKAGLILSRENKQGHYDRFRNRVMFPIFDVRQRIIGFGGRTLDDTAQPKYMNSPETPLYSKGRNLYGLNFSKGFIKEKEYAVIVEGYLDFIIPLQHGIKNVVATLGTALTSEQIKLLRRFANTVVIVYDADEAGQEASLRGLDILVSHDVNVRIATLPKGHDPDTFIRQNGAGAFEEIIKSSKDLFDYKMDLLMSRYNRDGVRGKAAIATLMLPTIARIQNDILKAAFLKKISHILDIDEGALRSELRKVRTDYSYEVPVKTPQPAKQKTRHGDIMLLSIVLDDPQLVAFIDERLGLDEVRDEAVKSIILAVKGLVKEGKEIKPAMLISDFGDERTKSVISEAVGLFDTVMDREKALFDCMKTVRKENFREDCDRLNREIRTAQEIRDMERVNVLMSQYDMLLKTHKGI